MTPPGGPGPSARGDEGNEGDGPHPREEETRGGRLRSLRRSPKALLLVVAVFVVILGIPGGLALAAGRWDVALWILGGFVLLVVATARVFRAAIAMERGEA